MSGLRRQGFGFVAAAVLLAAPIAAETYTVDPVHSSVGFSIRHLVSRSTGEFTDFSGTIQYDPAKPEASSFEGVIQVASLDTGNDKRDGHLKSADFFDAEKHPQITFKSTAVKAGSSGLMMTGQFTMHGRTKQIEFTVEVLGVGTNPMTKKPVAGFGADLTVKRSDYGVNNWVDAAGVLGDDVKVTLLIEANAAE